MLSMKQIVFVRRRIGLYLLREAGVPENTSVVVLGGEPATRRKVIPKENITKKKAGGK